MTFFALTSILLVGAACGAPNHLKHVEIDKQVVVNSGAPHSNLGASASWGPFSAGAGLGDGGIASAGAQAAGAGASAGVGGGSKATASASANAGAVSGYAPATGPSVFDQIFNIPISVLKSVNEHLNNRDTVPGAQRRLRKCRRRGVCSDDEGIVVSHSMTHGGANAGAGVNAGAHADSQASVYAKSVGVDGSAVSADAGAQSGGGSSTLNVRKNYDSVFSIPISALTSVNQLLNGKK